MKPFLILQLRPTDNVADDEFQAFLTHGELKEDEVHRVRMEQGNLPTINLDDYSGVIVGGGPTCASTPEETKEPSQQAYDTWLQALLDEIVEHDIPYLGCCYGLGALSLHEGGVVSKEKYSEPVHGIDIHLTPEGQQDPLFRGVDGTFRALVGHMESCQNIPPSATLLAKGDVCPVQMIRVKENVYATQFHPESQPENFILRIHTYKHAGYFPPEDAQKLIDQVKDEVVPVPALILKRFVEHYRVD